MFEQTKALEQIKRTVKKIMHHTNRIMSDDEASSYYIADDDIDKVDELVTAYGKQTGSSFINHQNFVRIRISNGIVDMHELRRRLKDRLQKDEDKNNVGNAISATEALDNISDFDFEMKYGADNQPASDFYNNDIGGVTQLNDSQVFMDIESSKTQYTVGPDIVYMFMLDWYNNVLVK